MSEQCPGCRATKYTNPMLKLLANVCGHTLCENCVEVMFVRGSGACPQCGTPLRRVNFRAQMFENSSVEKEMRIRKKIMKDFNKQESDFNSLREYNDYLELVEKLIFDIVNNENVEETKRLIERYKKENNDDIKRNRIKKTKEMEYLDNMIDEERSIREQVRREEEEEKKLLLNQKQQKERMIDELMTSEGSASAIVQQHMEATASTLRVREVNTNADVIQINAPPSTIAVVDGQPFEYRPFKLPLLGPTVDYDGWQAITQQREQQLGPQGVDAFHADWSVRLESLRYMQISHSGLFYGLVGHVGGDV